MYKSRDEYWLWYERPGGVSGQMGNLERSPAQDRRGPSTWESAFGP